MPPTPPFQETPGLTLAWRRRFVRLLAVAALGLLVTRSLAGIPPQVRYGGGALCLVSAVVALWFLLDAVRPWMAEDGDEEAAALRMAAGSRAHAALVWLAVGGWLYLWAAESGPVPLPPVQLDLTEVLVGFFLAGLFLPVAIASWRQPDRGATTGPMGLVRSRFRGQDAIGHLLSLGLVGVCAALAALAANPAHIDTAFGRRLMLIALALIVAATLAVLWLAYQADRRERSDVGQ